MFALILGYALTLAASLFLLQHHINLLAYPWFFTGPVILAVFMPLCVSFLLPMDYVLHNAEGHANWLNVPDSVILHMWKASYWSTFLLTWLVIPILLEFFRSGSFTRMGKLKASIRKNLRFQGMLLVIGIFGWVYLLLETGLTISNIKLMIIALSHIFALVLAVWLMSHGLVSIPRGLWVQGDIQKDLNRHYLKIPSLVDSLEDAKVTLKEESFKVILLKENYASRESSFLYKEWILMLHDMIPPEINNEVRRSYTHRDSSSIRREQITDRYMDSLGQNFVRHVQKVEAYTSEYNRLLQQITRLQTLQDAKSAGDRSSRFEVMDSINSRFPLSYNHYIECHVKPLLARFFSIVLYVVAFVVVESEVFHSSKISLMNILVYKTNLLRHSFYQAALCLLIFMYMLFCTLNLLVKLKIFNMYHLVPHSSDPVSVCFYVSYIARMTVPLSYNFLNLFVSRDLIFETWYGQSVHLTGLFNLLNNWVPRLLLVPIILTTFNIYGSVKKKLGIDSGNYLWVDLEYEDSGSGLAGIGDQREESVIAEAKRMVASELNRRSIQSQQELGSQSYASVTRGLAPNLLDRNVEYDLNNRIDNGEFTDGSTRSETLWSKLGDTLSDLRGAVSDRIGRRGYRDDPDEASEDFDGSYV